MRILFVTEESIDFSGAMVRGGQIHVKKVVEGLRERGHDVHLVDWNDSPTEEFQHSISPRTRFVDGPIRTLRQVLTVGRSIDPDVIISKTRKVYLPGLIAAYYLDVPHVVHVGSSLNATGNGIVERLDAGSKSIRLRAPHDSYFVVCDAFREELVGKGVDPERIYNVRNAVDPRRFCPDPDVELPTELLTEIRDTDRPLLGYVGSISRKKGVLDLAKAAAKSSINPIVLVIGDGPILHEFSNKLGDRGYFGGTISYEYMPAVYSKMNAFILPSYSEGLPRSILEASASGIPVIATRVGGIPEVVEDGHTGLLYEARDVGALTDSIDVLFEEYDPHELGRAGRELVVDGFTWEAQFDRYQEFLYTVLAAGQD